MLRYLILRHKSADPLNPGTVPGTRSVNNFPLYLFICAVVIFLAIVGIVMMQRSKTVEREKEMPKNTGGSTQFASEYTAPWTSGLVPSDEEKKPETPPLVVPESPAQSPRASTPALTFPPLREVVRNETGDRFQNNRLQQFELALKSRTGVQVARGSGPRSSEEIQERTRATRQQLAAMGNDPMSAYQARLASMSGGGAGKGQDAPNSLDAARAGQPQFTRDNWTLNESVGTPVPFTLQAGFVLPAIMISGINSNLPGQVMAQISQNVYDTPTGQHLLIPQGTRLIGTYNSDVAYGQERVLMAWQRLLFPDGHTLNIQAMPGTDSAGYAGFEDQVNNHYIRMFTSAFLLSGVIAAVSMSQDSSRDTGNHQRASDALSESLGQTLGSAMSEMLRKNLNISPTLQIRPGYRFNVMVTKDMNFEGPYRSLLQ